MGARLGAHLLDGLVGIAVFITIAMVSCSIVGAGIGERPICSRACSRPPRAPCRFAGFAALIRRFGKRPIPVTGTGNIFSFLTDFPQLS